MRGGCRGELKRPAKKTGRQPHNQAYWDKLRQQFQSCSYDQTGAYSEVRQAKNGATGLIQEQIEQREQRDVAEVPHGT